MITKENGYWWACMLQMWESLNHLIWYPLIVDLPNNCLEVQVTGVKSFGAFVNVGAEADGLLKVSIGNRWQNGSILKMAKYGKEMHLEWETGGRWHFLNMFCTFFAQKLLLVAWNSEREMNRNRCDTSTTAWWRTWHSSWKEECRVVGQNGFHGLHGSGAWTSLFSKSRYKDLWI